jgi:hypothetical protein
MYKNGSVAFFLFPLLLSSGFPVAETAARAGNALTTVRVLTDKSLYSRGEPIVITIHNDLTTFIYAPPGAPYCSVITVQRLEGGKWLPEKSCVASAPSDPPSVIAIAARSRTWGTVGETARVPDQQGPTVSPPVKPLAEEENLPAPPPSKPRKQGESIPEIPEGGRRPPFSALDGALRPGWYRIQFAFMESAIKGPIHIVYSNEFAVTG